MRRIGRAALLTVCLLMALDTGAFAWDGERKGFILAIGLGPGLTSFQGKWHDVIEGTTTTADREFEPGLRTDLRIGYAPSNDLQIYWTSKVSWFGVVETLQINGHYFREEYTVATGVAGLGLTYYLSPRAPSAFLCSSLGYSSWSTPFEEWAESSYGLGLSVGGGVEFARHWTVEGSLTWGKPSEEYYDGEWSVDAVSVGFTVNLTGY